MLGFQLFQLYNVRISIISIAQCEDFNYFNYTMQGFQGWDANDVSARERFTAFLISPCVEEVRFSAIDIEIILILILKKKHF